MAFTKRVLQSLRGMLSVGGRGCGVAAALALAVVAVAPLRGADPPKPELKFHGPSPTTVKLSEGSGSIIVEGLNLPTPGAGKPRPVLQIRDVGGEGPAGLKIKFSVQEVLPAPARGAHNWKVDLTVEGMEPESEIPRTASLAYGDFGVLADYKLDNRAGGSFTWELAAPPQAVVLERNRETSLTITTGDRPATGIQLVHSSLQDATSKALLGVDKMQLEGGDTVGKKTTKKLTLKFENVPYPGVYTGSVTVAVNQQGATKPFNLTVYNSSNWHRFFGVIFIAAGIAASLFLGVYARNKVNRLEALRNVEILEDRLAHITPTLQEAKERLEKAGDKDALPSLHKLHKRLKKQLSEEELDSRGLLPPTWIIDAANAEQRSTDLKNHLTKMAGLLGIFDEVVMRGLRTVLDKWVPQKANDCEDALRELDSLVKVAADEEAVDAAKELQNVRPKVSAVIGKIENLQGAEARFSSAAGDGARDRTAEDLTVELENLRGDIWTVWAIVTVAAGFVAVILSNPGFGTGMDFAKCFFWGLGVQVAGQQLQQLSPGKLATVFKLPVPKE